MKIKKILKKLKEIPLKFHHSDLHDTLDNILEKLEYHIYHSPKENKELKEEISELKYILNKLINNK